MRILLLLLFISTNLFAQDDPRMAYSQYSRLGINGPVKSITTYKYTNLKYDDSIKENTEGTLYSVIKNEYDSSGYLIHDSTIIFINKQSASVGYYRDYTYSDSPDNNTILVETAFEAEELLDEKRGQGQLLVLSNLVCSWQRRNLVLVKDINIMGKRGKKGEPALQGSYRFYYEDSLIVRTNADEYEKGKKTVDVDASYEYDEYGNFTRTIEKVGNAPKKTIRHEVLKIDTHGNATLMLNYENDSPKPDFMTSYHIEYYE